MLYVQENMRILNVVCTGEYQILTIVFMIFQNHKKSSSAPVPQCFNDAPISPCEIR